MAKIQIPFREDMATLAILGKKTATSRNSRYGDPGDTFELKGVEFEIIRIIRKTLALIATDWYKEEGFNSPEEFEIAWKELHPRKGYDPFHRVWLHEFKRITDLSTLPDEFLLSLEKFQEERQ